MPDPSTIRNTWEKVLEYASSPLHGTMSRKLRKGVKLQINRDFVFEEAQIFISETFVRLTQNITETDVSNTYFDIDKIASITTISSI
jgi:hypothetical protein